MKVPGQIDGIECCNSLIHWVFSSTVHQSRSQNEAEEAMTPPKKLVKIFRCCFVSISTVRKQTEGSVGLM